MVGLQFIVGISLPPLTLCNLPKPSGCGIRTAELLDLWATAACLLRAFDSI
jgi:hypothetical protein